MSRASGNGVATTPLRSVVDPLPAGSYDVIVSSAEVEETSTGNLMCRIAFTVERGPQMGRTVTCHLVCVPEVPDSVGYFFSQLRALGLSSADFAALSGDTAEQSIGRALVGRRAHLTVAPAQPSPETVGAQPGAAVDPESSAGPITTRSGVPASS